MGYVCDSQKEPHMRVYHIHFQLNTASLYIFSNHLAYKFMSFHLKYMFLVLGFFTFFRILFNYRDVNFGTNMGKHRFCVELTMDHPSVTADALLYRQLLTKVWLLSKTLVYKVHGIFSPLIFGHNPPPHTHTHMHMHLHVTYHFLPNYS